MSATQRKVDEVVEITIPIFDLAELERLVRLDEMLELFDGTCSIHDGCRSLH